MWARSAATIVAATSLLGLAFVVGWPVLLTSGHAIRGALLGASIGGLAPARLAIGPFFCLYCVPLAGVALSAIDGSHHGDGVVNIRCAIGPDEPQHPQGDRVGHGQGAKTLHNRPPLPAQDRVLSRRRRCLEIRRERAQHA